MPEPLSVISITSSRSAYAIKPLQGNLSGPTSFATAVSSCFSTSTKMAKSAPAAPMSGRYVVHFHSGLTQPADEVEDQGNYWYVKYGARVYPVRKALVSQIEEPA